MFTFIWPCTCLTSIRQKKEKKKKLKTKLLFRFIQIHTNWQTLNQSKTPKHSTAKARHSDTNSSVKSLNTNNRRGRQYNIKKNGSNLDPKGDNPMKYEALERKLQVCESRQRLVNVGMETNTSIPSIVVVLMFSWAVKECREAVIQKAVGGSAFLKWVYEFEGPVWVIRRRRCR